MPSEPAAIGRAAANPTKEFFVSMLTRDISIEGCILDLIDNSVDAALESEGGSLPGIEPSSRLDGYTVELTIRPDKFEIRDNCGGLSLEDATQYAFNFGNRDVRADTSLSIGVYGIGMKRAVFKLGTDIEVSSTHLPSEHSTPQGFRVPIDVGEWLSSTETEWQFPILADEPAAEPGLRITVTNLRPEVKQAFEDPEFEPRLRRILARDYMLALGHELKIVLNSDDVVRSELSLRTGEGFVPMRQEYTDGDVNVTIIAGMGRPPSDDSGPDSLPKQRIESGWNIFCNGRAVLTGDTTTLSGWGVDPTPRWHPQYNGFSGFVFFTSEDPALLPMTTTKRSVDPSSSVYKRALARMSSPARAWTNYTNERKSRIDEARTLERAAVATPISTVTESPTAALPKLVKPTVPVANINFSRSRKEVRALAAAFGNRLMSYRDVGIKAFEFAYDAKVDEDEDDA